MLFLHSYILYIYFLNIFIHLLIYIYLFYLDNTFVTTFFNYFVYLFIYWQLTATLTSIFYFFLGTHQENNANRWRSWKSCSSCTNYNLYPFLIFVFFRNLFFFCFSITALTICIPRTLELFVHSLLTKTMQITSNKNAKTLSTSHM